MNKFLSFSFLLALFASLNAMENKGKNPVRDNEEIAQSAAPSGTYESVLEKTNYPELSPEEKKNFILQMPFSQMPFSMSNGFDDSRKDARSILIRLIAKQISLGKSIPTTFVYSPDNKYLALVSKDNTIHIIDQKTMQTVHTVMHSDPINFVAFSPDSKYLATASDKWTALCIIDLATMETMPTIDYIYSANFIAFSPDSKYLATTSSAHVACIIDLATMNLLTILADSIAFSPDSKYLATTSHHDKTARIVDLATMKIVHTVTHNDAVVGIAFSPDSKYLATASPDRTACIVDLTTMKTVHTINHKEWVRSVAFSPNSQYLAIAGHKTAHIIDFATMKTVHTVTYNDYIYFIKFSPDSKYLATAGDKTTHIIDLATMKIMPTVTHHGWLHSATFSPDSQYLAIGAPGSDYAPVYIIDLATMKTVHTIDHSDSVAFSPDSQYLATTSCDDAHIIDLAIIETVHTIDHNNRVHANKFIPDSTYCAIGSDDSTARIIDIKTPALIADSMNLNEYELLKALQRAGGQPAQIHASPEQWAIWQLFREKLPEHAQKKLEKLITRQ